MGFLRLEHADGSTLLFSIKAMGVSLCVGYVGFLQFWAVGISLHWMGGISLRWMGGISQIWMDGISQIETWRCQVDLVVPARVA